jgi:hypothetical protein
MKLTPETCITLFSEKLPNGADICAQHLAQYEQILLHTLAGELVNVPLTALLRKNTQPDSIRQYCDVIETMWKQGNDAVANVVEVTILEYLTDDPILWHRFGEYISEEFKKYINAVCIPENLRYFGAEILK